MIAKDTKCRHGLDKVNDKLLATINGDNAGLADEIAALTRKKVTKPTILVGTGTCGLAAGAGATLTKINSYLEGKKIDADVIEVGCVGLCAVEPTIEVQMPGKTRVTFQKATADTVEAIMDGCMSGNIPAETVFGQVRDDSQESYAGMPYVDEHPFMAMQQRLVLANCGSIDPTRIDEYIAGGGYQAFAKVLKMERADVCEEVLKSGLRGRGGGGFPTGQKWKFALNAEASQKYMVCNADEGDPGAFMDRAVIEGDPHKLLEGMAIGAYAIGATKAYCYLRAEYPLAIERFEEAIKQAHAWGLLGKNIMGTGFDLEIVIKKGAGAFVCGEETALIHSIEGKRGMPRPRPPFPAISGLFGKPTVVNNVETFANLANIINKGANWFASIGTDNSKGTKVFALSGKINRTGLVEVPMGTALRDIIFNIGGGIQNDRQFKGVQIGGPSGGCIPTQHLDIEIDYESLKTVGAMMGSGGLVVMDEDTCMVDVAKFFMDFIQRESCGKCIPCREGTRRMLEILERITHNRGSESTDEETLARFKGIMYIERLAEVIKDTSLCGLGQTAPNPILSTLRWFRDEYEAHIYDRKCPAGACKSLLTYEISAEECKGCTICAKKCPVGAIEGSVKEPHVINMDKCIACGTCIDVCKFNAVKVG